MEEPVRTFVDRIYAMNKMYDLHINDKPTDLGPNRTVKFYKTLRDEVEELTELGITPLERLVSLADLLGDVIVYCRSEAMRWGIPLEEVLDIIMDSNESKLDENGKPIYNENGKFLKGPNYWPPEDKIRELIKSRNPELK